MLVNITMKIIIGYGVLIRIVCVRRMDAWSVCDSEPNPYQQLKRSELYFVAEQNSRHVTLHKVVVPGPEVPVALEH